MNREIVGKKYMNEPERFRLERDNTRFRPRKAARINKLQGLKSFKELLTLYRSHLEMEGKSIRTVISYCQTIQFYTSFMANCRGKSNHWQFFTPMNLALFISYLRKVRRCRDSSIRTRMSALASYSAFLVKSGLLINNPVQILRKAVKSGASPGAGEDLNHSLLTQYMRKKKLSPRSLRNLLIIELIHQTGMNASELSELHVEDVIWSRGLPCSLVISRGRRPRLVILKDKYLREMLYLYIVIRKLQVGSRLIKGRSGMDRGLHPSSILRMIKTACQKAGLGILIISVSGSNMSLEHVAS